MRNNRKIFDLRPITITKDYMKNPLSSCLIEHGKTKLFVVYPLEEKVPR